MGSADSERIARAARRLTVAINAQTGDVAEAWLDHFCKLAMQSARNMDAAFAAVQTLRDLDTIDRAEAAYVFAELFECQVFKDSRKPDPELDRAAREGLDYELIVAAMSDRETRRAAAFHRERGEDALADMMFKDPEAYGLLCADGQISLILDKPPSEEARERPKPPAPALVVSERVLALSGAETLQEWRPAWLALCESLRDADPSDAVAAIQRVRDVSGISFNESLVLIDLAIEPLVTESLSVDREYHRLVRALSQFNRLHKVADDDEIADESRPLEYQVLQYRRRRRIDGMTAVCLRRFGEHRLANLLMTDPEEYARVRDNMEVGGPRARR